MLPPDNVESRGKKQAGIVKSRGKFFDNDTVMAWMETWGTDHERKPPL